MKDGTMHTAAAYREYRAAIRRLHVAIIDSVDGMHRALVHGDSQDAARYADDLGALSASLINHIRWVREYSDQTTGGAPASERSAQ